MEVTLNVRGNLKQLEVCKAWVDDTVEEILFGGAKGGGKSHIGCSLIFGDALMYPNTHYFIARKELADLRKHTIPSIYEVFTHWGLPDHAWKYNGQDNYFELSNGSKVFLLACTHLPSDPLFERFGSMQMTRGWIEEGGEVPEEAKRNLWLTIGRWKNDVYGLKKKLLITCNPKKNWMYRDFYKPFQLNSLPKSKIFIQAFATDNKTLPADYVQSLEALTGVARQRLWLGNWDYEDDDNALMTFDTINDCFTNSHVKPGRRCMTLDIALEGSDRFVIGVWDGFILQSVAIIPKIKPKELIDKVMEVKQRFGIQNSNIVYDADGVGTYVGGWVQGAKAFHNGGSPVKQNGKPQNYLNLKTQCEYLMAERVNRGEVWLKDLQAEKNTTIEEMEQVKSWLGDKEGKLRTMPKDERKANIGRSPDIWDMIMMREYLELFPESKGVTYSSQRPR